MKFFNFVIKLPDANIEEKTLEETFHEEVGNFFSQIYQQDKSNLKLKEKNAKEQ